MICVDCNSRREIWDGGFIRDGNVDGVQVKRYIFKCPSCLKSVPIDATTKKEPQVPPKRAGTAPRPAGEELPPVEAYETDEGTPYNDPIPF